MQGKTKHLSLLRHPASRRPTILQPRRLETFELLYGPRISIRSPFGHKKSHSLGKELTRGDCRPLGQRVALRSSNSEPSFSVIFAAALNCSVAKSPRR